MVYIIGTGPGDEDLLTLKAIKVLKKCTAVLYDRLSASNVLNYINEDCKIYYCGKMPGAHSKTQEEINDLIIKLAKEGHTVGRIKGGDPFIFGRGGEEILALSKEKIDFEVIPGITSFISVLNYAGIPVTHRKIAQDFHVVTGKSQDESNVNYSALAKEKGTLIFMMGLGKLNEIVHNLIINGKSKDTPVAVVMKGTTSKQKKVVGILSNILKKVEEEKFASPCIIVVGEVVKFSDTFNWYEKKPLFGHNICITRAKKQSLSLKDKLLDLGAQVTEINSIEIKDTSYNLDKYIDKLKEYDYIVFTSTNGVNIFFDYLLNKSYDIRNLNSKFVVIGKATEKALKSKLINPYLVADTFTICGLTDKLISKVSKNEKILQPGSSKSKTLLKETLEKVGVTVDMVSIYDTICGRLLDDNVFDEVDEVLFASPSAVKNMISLVGVSKLKTKKSIAIGHATEEELKKYNIKSIVCKKQSEDGFIEAIFK